MEYQEFLFNKLCCLMCNDFALLAYDIQYPATKAEYKLFDLSEENKDESKSEYECMLDYLETRVDDINSRYKGL
mgnify:CR=1|jgi:hypothetical protein